jgi:phosphotriesterase-related protein
MGCGYYIEPFHPDDVARMSVDAVADRITADVTDGVGATGIRAGFIGEIGISRDFTSEEEKVLRGAARAQARVHVPLSVHLPGWKRYGLRVLDVVEEEGADPAACILCHMNPSHADEDYQHAIADRGAWLEYDMIGMDWYYADADEQCPCDEELAISIATLARAGYLQRLLLSSDVFLKMMLVRYGGFGYAHVLENFLPRLRRHGLSENDVWQLVTDNPRKVFETAGARGGV